MYFDFAMPLTLFAVTLIAMLLNDKVEGKLKGVFEEKKFGFFDALLLIGAISVTVWLIVFIPQMAVMIIFLFAYSALLFTFTYIFSNFQKFGAKLFCTAFLTVTFLISTVFLFTFIENSVTAYGVLTFFGIFSFTFLALLYEENRASVKERWYLAVLPPALFISLYIFFSRTPIWFPYLLNLYGIIFAVLIILYLGSLFTWKTTLFFAGALTFMDILLVLFSGAMVSAATHVSGLRLPVLITLPTVPEIVTEFGKVYMSLGLGDFFFAGLLGLQTLKKFGKEVAVLSAIGMGVSFFIFEAFLLNYRPGAFPGTLMIICGWIPFILWKSLKGKR
ncbi:MAG: hypothetical protein QHH17_07830 [Candidatus Bathyarchaeota archaeon]|jgi:hypothetical protein|nr:hypothetical protein [Candidatus Bathyarchaeota archaeon]